MNNFIKVAPISDLVEGGANKYSLKDTEIVIIKLEGKIFVIDNLCPHQHAPTMSESSIHNMQITCPLHDWTFDLVTGGSDNEQGRLKKYNYMIENEDIYVEIKDQI
jgi:nitrite reductase (NADH) small subunit